MYKDVPLYYRIARITQELQINHAYHIKDYMEYAKPQ